jgi:hypothetical protein
VDAQKVGVEVQNGALEDLCYQWLQIRIAGSESGSPVPHESEEIDGLTKKLTVVAATFHLL